MTTGIVERIDAIASCDDDDENDDGSAIGDDDEDDDRCNFAVGKDEVEKDSTKITASLKNKNPPINGNNNIIMIVCARTIVKMITIVM